MLHLYNFDLQQVNNNEWHCGYLFRKKFPYDKISQYKTVLEDYYDQWLIILLTWLIPYLYSCTDDNL